MTDTSSVDVYRSYVGGEMGARMRAFDWSKTELGAGALAAVITLGGLYLPQLAHISYAVVGA